MQSQKKILLLFSIFVLFDHVYGVDHSKKAINDWREERYEEFVKKFGFKISREEEQTESLALKKDEERVGFKTSKESDIKKYFFYVIKKVEEIYKAQGVSIEDAPVQDWMQQSILLTYGEKLKLISDFTNIPANTSLDVVSQEQIEWFKDLQKTFDALKKLMHIPEEVQLILAPNEIVVQGGVVIFYSLLDRAIFLMPDSLSLTRSRMVFTLIHELTHVQQHMRMDILEFLSKPRKKIEQEAERQAAQAIKCRMCMQAIESGHLVMESQMCEEELNAMLDAGYLIARDFTQYKKRKSMLDLCDFHKDNPLNGRLSKEEIFCSDRDNGSMLERLSTVRFK